MNRCLYPVRVLTNEPWDLTWPGERACGEPADHTWELGFYLDGYNEPGLTRHRTNLFTMSVCRVHAEIMPSLRLVGSKSAELVAPGKWR